MRIDVIISPTGETRLETHGYRGQACLEATRRLIASLGPTSAERLTAEFYLPAYAPQRLPAPVERA